jgi:hypothetical protein
MLTIFGRTNRPLHPQHSPTKIHNPLNDHEMQEKQGNQRIWFFGSRAYSDVFYTRA